MHIPIALSARLSVQPNKETFGGLLCSLQGSIGAHCIVRDVLGEDFLMLPTMLPTALWISLLSIPADVGRIPCNGEIVTLQPTNKEDFEVVLDRHKLRVVYSRCFVELFAGCHDGHPYRREPKRRLILGRPWGLCFVAAVNHPVDFGLNASLSTSLLSIGQDWPTTVSVSKDNFVLRRIFSLHASAITLIGGNDDKSSNGDVKKLPI